MHLAPRHTGRRSSSSNPAARRSRVQAGRALARSNEDRVVAIVEVQLDLERAGRAAASPINREIRVPAINREIREYNSNGGRGLVLLFLLRRSGKRLRLKSRG
jgi:hypothetical protein